MMAINDHVRRFRADLAASPTFLQDKVRKYFIDNPHKLTVTMTPDESYAEVAVASSCCASKAHDVASRS